MIKELNGNLFDSKADVLCHQVNTMGVMGAGIALEVRKRFPAVYEEYKKICKSMKDERYLYGDTLILPTNESEKQYIANVFGQSGWGTDYGLLESSLKKVVAWMERNGKKTVAFPHGMSSGLAGGDWRIVRGIIEAVFYNTGIDIEIWKLG